jgi:cytochrome c-type biogenesis protein CcmH/NrfG
VTAGLTILLALVQAASPEVSARKAVGDFNSGRYAEARQELRTAIENDPKNAALWAYLGLAEAQLNDVAAAIGDLEKARTLAPEDPQILFNLGLFYGSNGKDEKAREAYRHGLQLDPQDVAGNQNYALLLMKNGHFAEAIEPLNRLRTLLPANRGAEVSLIECLSKSGNQQEAGIQIRSFAEGSGTTLDDCVKASSIFVEDGALSAAELLLAGCEERFKEAPELYAGLGKLLLERGDYEGAVRQIGTAAQLRPDVPGYSLGLVEALLLWKHYTPALQLLSALRPKFGTLTDYRYKMGLAWYGLHRYTDALAEFEAVIKERPEADSAWYFLGNTWLTIGELDNAEHAYRKAIGLNPKAAAYYAALGDLLRRSEQDRVAEAAAALEEAIHLDPSDSMSRKELALCEERRGDLTRAAELLGQVTRERPDFKEAHVAYARVCYKLHRTTDGDRERQIVAQLEVQERAAQSTSPSVPTIK